MRIELIDLIVRCSMVSIEAIVLIYYLITARRFVKGFYSKKPSRKTMISCKERNESADSKDSLTFAFSRESML